MGRSVSYPRNAQSVVYSHVDFDDDDPFLWYDLLDDYAYTARRNWPSLRPCDEWIGSEDRALLSNDLAYFGVSEYCGLVSIWLAPVDDDNPLAIRWINQAHAKMVSSFATLNRVGTFSNGEGVFQWITPRAQHEGAKDEKATS